MTAQDTALLAAIRERDEGALAALYDLHSGTVYAFCLRTLGDVGDAEDCLIDIFWEIWNRHDRYDPSRGDPLAYVFGLARSRATDRLRARRTRRQTDARAFPEVRGRPSAARQPYELAVQSEEGREIRRAMAALAPKHRQALDLAFFQGLSHAEVARSLGEPLGTVKARIRQALLRLRGALAAEDECGCVPAVDSPLLSGRTP